MKVKRKLREASLVLDSEEPALGKSPGNTRGLNIRTPVYIGGLNTKKYTYAEAVGVTRGFTGCILQVWLLGSKKKRKKCLFSSEMDPAEFRFFLYVFNKERQRGNF